MDRRGFPLVVVLTCMAGGVCGLKAADAPVQAPPLRPVAAFAAITDEQARSMALFKEAARVIQNPRCLNCHPATRQPTQGDDLHPHIPPMDAGPTDHGPGGFPCKSCHGNANVATAGSRIASIPGDPRWSVAPPSMAWQKKSTREICLQIKDSSRNGGRSLEQIHTHLATDPLVGWAWHPGAGRMPAPGTQAELGELIKAWISTGAHCPES